MICVGGACATSACGDAFVDTARGEQCDDGNETAYDGCEPVTCRYTCDSDDACDDHFVCNGAERCVEHRCATGEPAGDGTSCSTDDVPAGVCHPLPTPVCQAAECGNRVRDEGEECDDGRNGDATDGCGDECTFTCSGSSAGCALAITPPFYDFGSVVEGTTSTEQTFTVQNVSSGATTVAPTIRSAGAHASEFVVDAGTCTLVIGPFLSCTFTAHYAPSGAGPRQAMIVIEAGDGFAGAAEVRGYALGDLGTTCAADGACAAGHCTDGVCCGSSAADCGGCNACNVAGEEGTCAPVPSGEDPHGACAGLECASGTCDGSGACAPGNAGMVCQADGCSGAQLLEHLCDGASTGCPETLTRRVCPDFYGCRDATSCETSCTDDAQCSPNAYCEDGSCHYGLSPPAACTRDRQCNSGRCEGGICRRCVGTLMLNQCNYDSEYCRPTADGSNECVNCTTAGGSSFCAANGIGDTCAAGWCQCSSNTQCTHAEAPSCLPRVLGDGSTISTCGCYYAWPYPDSPLYTCPRGRRICVANVPMDINASCKAATGEPCATGADCVSGVCSAGICGL